MKGNCRYLVQLYIVDGDYENGERLELALTQVNLNGTHGIHV